MAHRSEGQSLQEELTCVICCDLFRDPVMLDCMHHFCKECIQNYWESCSKVATCPQCRREFPTRSFRPQYLISGVVETVRRYNSEEHQRNMQKYLSEAIQLCQTECEKLMRMKHATEENICTLLKTSSDLNSKIRAEFEHLHRVLEEEERTVLMGLAKEKEQWLLKLEGDSAQINMKISELKKTMESIKQKLDKLGSTLHIEFQVQVALQELSRAERKPTMPVEALTAFSREQLKDLYDGPLQYVFWKRMLKSISPAPAPLHLDPESAHPNLVLSKDLTAVTETKMPQSVPSTSRRFLQSVNVLARESFERGRHYWEVWVGSKTKWDLGVAADSVDRTVKVKLCPENGYWTVRLREHSQYWALATPWVCLNPQRVLKKVGVLLDCRANKVAFYNAEDMSLLFTFHQAKARKFYPFFSTCFSDGKNAEPIKICHLNL